MRSTIHSKSIRFLRRLGTQRSFSLNDGAAATVGLEVPLPGIPELKPAKDLEAPKLEMTTLPSGIRVASMNTTDQVSAVSAFIDTGSKYETVRGVCSHLEKMTFSNTGRSASSPMTRIEMMGGVAHSMAAREQTCIAIEALRDHVGESVEILSDIVQKREFDRADITEAEEITEIQREEMAYASQELTMEYLHAAAYGGDSALGHPVMCPSKNFGVIGPDELRDFVETQYSPDNLVVAGVGVEHTELTDLIEKYFNDMPDFSCEKARSGSSNASNRSLESQKIQDSNVYVGGDIRVLEEPLVRSVSSAHAQQLVPFTHMALGFHIGGWNDPDLVPLSVLFSLLGGGHSFSAGGPGKGLYTRIYREVLMGYSFVESMLATAAVYDDTGIFSIYGCCMPQSAGHLVDIICNQFWNIANTPVTEEELFRARNQLKSQVLMNLESRGLLVDDIGRSTLTFGKRQDPLEVCERIEKVSAEDLQRVARDMIRTPPSFVAYGDQQSVQPYEAIQSAFDRTNQIIGNV